MSGASASPSSSPPSVAKPSVLLQPMPIPRTVGAPLFDGKYVREFISILERHGEIAGLTEGQLPAYVLQYCSEEVKKVIRWSDKLDGKDWNKAKEFLIGLYGSSDKPSSVSIDDLHDFVKETRTKREFTKRVDIDRYHQKFLSIAGQLKKKGELTETEMQLKFLAGLPALTRAFFTTRLPEANKEVKNPPTIAQMIKIICDRFNPKSIESYGYESSDDEDLTQNSSSAPRITILPQKSAAVEPAKLPSLGTKSALNSKSNGSFGDIDAITQQLQQLSLNQTQLMSALNLLSSQSNSNRR